MESHTTQEKSQQNVESTPSNELPFFKEENDSYECYINVGEYACNTFYEELKDAKKSIKIISPYLSEKRIIELEKRCHEGVAIHLITSVPDDPKEISNEILQCMKRLINRIRDNEYRLCHRTIIFKDHDHHSNDNDHQANCYNLHTKLYIIDDEKVYSGSFNFTNSGMTNNIETAITFKAPKVVEKFIQYFENMFSTDLIKKWDISELGDIIYSIKTVRALYNILLEKNNKKDNNEFFSTFSKQMIEKFNFDKKYCLRKDPNMLLWNTAIDQSMYEWAIENIKL